MWFIRENKCLGDLEGTKMGNTVRTDWENVNLGYHIGSCVYIYIYELSAWGYIRLKTLGLYEIKWITHRGVLVCRLDPGWVSVKSETRGRTSKRAWHIVASEEPREIQECVHLKRALRKSI